MKKIAFVSDFDNTISKKDFYHIMMDHYLGEEGHKFYEEWKRSKKINVEFLNKIFGSVKLTEDEFKKEVLAIPIDQTVLGLIKKVKASGNDFYIVSAGTSYYIDILLEELGIKGVSVISMEGIYENGVLQIHPDKNSPYYSELFGLDKSKFIESIREKYSEIYYAGDSEPDFTAAKLADVRFAKGELAEMLDREGVEFVRFGEFRDIEKYLAENKSEEE